MTTDKIAKVVILCSGTADPLFLRSTSPQHLGNWDLPGGHLEEGETALEAVVREVREETGIDLTIVYEMYEADDTTFFVSHMRGGVKDIEKKIVLSSEHDDFRYIPPEEFDDLPISEPYIEAVNYALEERWLK